MNQHRKAHSDVKPTFAKVLLAGACSAFISSILAVTVYWIMRSATGLNPPQLQAFSIFMAAITTNLIGSIIYYLFIIWTRSPKLLFTILALLIATFNSLYLILFDSTAGLALIANPIHYIVAITSIIVISRVTNKRFD